MDINGVTYIKISNTTNLCKGCVGEDNDSLCDKLADDCQYATYREEALAEGTHRGFHPEIVKEFIQGNTIQYSNGKGNTWTSIPKYNNTPGDIYRVSGPNYLFRKKPTTEVKYYEVVSKLGTSEPTENSNLRVTFVNNKPDSLKLL